MGRKGRDDDGGGGAGGKNEDEAKPGEEAHLSFHSCNPSNLDY